MTATDKSYWSIDACAWVRSPRGADADVPGQRGAAEEETDAEALDLDAEVPAGVPI